MFWFSHVCRISHIRLPRRVYMCFCRCRIYTFPNESTMRHAGFIVCTVLFWGMGCCLQANTVAATVSTCVTPDVRPPQQIFSIDVYSNVLGPVIPVLRKKMCMTGAPHIDIRIGRHQFNLLNATISATACQDMYRKLICNYTRDTYKHECMYANQIMFAATQRIIACDTDVDCIGIRQTYDTPLLHCAWAQTISKHVCKDPVHSLVILNECEADAEKGLHIRDACIFTNPMCAYVVENINIISPVLGVGLFCLSFAVIFFSH